MNALALINKLATSSPQATSTTTILDHPIQRTSSTSSSNSAVTTTTAGSGSTTKNNINDNNSATTQLMSTLAALASAQKPQDYPTLENIAKDSNDCSINGNKADDNSSDAAKLLASLLALSERTPLNNDQLFNDSNGSSTTTTNINDNKTTITNNTTGNNQRGPVKVSNANDIILKQHQRRIINPTSNPVNQHAQPLRDLEKWHDDTLEPLDDSFLRELEDNCNNSKGWSADEMFKYNEKVHNITTSYNERTHAKSYSTPLSKLNHKTTLRLASQLAKEIEDKVAAEGRITPESSDDDELFEKKRMQRLQLKQRGQLDQLLKAHQRHSQQQRNNFSNNINSGGKLIRSSEKCMNSTKTLASPMLNHRESIKPVTSSSRNILRACLT